MKIKFLILSLFAVIAAAFLGCIDSKNMPVSNDTQTPPSEPVISTPKEKLPDIESQKVDIAFETWSRGYWSNSSYDYPYFRVINDYNEWNDFLDEQGYFAWIRGKEGMRLEGSLYPGINIKPKNITSADFNDYFIIAAMMGMRGYAEGPEIEIENISGINSIVNVSVRLYDPRKGAAVVSAPYHVIIIKKQLIAQTNITFDFIDIENGRLLVRIVKGDYKSFPPVIEALSSDHPALRNNSGLIEVSENYYFGNFKQDCAIRCEGKELRIYISGYPMRWAAVEDIVVTLQNAFTGSERLEKIEIMPEKEESVVFKTVAVGDWSGYTSPAFMVINNRTEWANVWQKHSNYLKAQKPSLPEINFTNETGVAVFSGESHAYDAGLINITKAGRNIFVNLQKKFPASRSSVQPYFMVRISKTGEDIIFRTLKWEYG